MCLNYGTLWYVNVHKPHGQMNFACGLQVMDWMVTLVAVDEVTVTLVEPELQPVAEDVMVAGAISSNHETMFTSPQK